MTEKQTPLIFYALDDSPLHLFLASQSLKSLRRHNPHIPVLVVLFGVSDHLVKNRFEKLGATVKSVPKPRKTPTTLPSTFLKWRALKFVTSERALYVDGDTWFFEDPEVFMDLYSKKDFYAREEFGTRPGIGFQLLGNFVMPPQIHPKKFAAIASMFGASVEPIFNTGIMVFNHHFAQEMANRINEFEEIFEFFVDRPKFYPAENLHIADEVIASLVFGRLKKFSKSRIRKKDSPWYCEWKGRAVSDPGLIMHYWSKYSPFFVREFIGKSEAKKMPFLLPVERGYVEY